MYTNKKIVSALLDPFVASRTLKIMSGLLLMIIMCAATASWCSDDESAFSNGYKDFSFAGQQQSTNNLPFLPLCLDSDRDLDPLLLPSFPVLYPESNTTLSVPFLSSNIDSSPVLLPDADLDSALLLSSSVPCPDPNSMLPSDNDDYGDWVCSLIDFNNSNGTNAQSMPDVYAGASAAVEVEVNAASGGSGAVKNPVVARRKRSRETVANSAIGIDAEQPKAKKACKDKKHVCGWKGCFHASISEIDLKNHIRTHTGEKPFVCDFDGCNHATAQPSNLVRHKRIHANTGEKRFVCDFDGCNHATDRKENLTAHARTHTGKRPYVCDFPGCDHTALKLSNLKKHEKTHAEKKPYECDFVGCDYVAHNQWALTKHKGRPHIDPCKQVFKCSRCDYTTSQANDYDKHAKVCG